HLALVLFFSGRSRHTSFSRDWSSDVGSSDLVGNADARRARPFVGVAEHEPALELAAHALERRARQHAFRRASLAQVHVDAGDGRSEERRVGKVWSATWPR